MEKKKNNAVEKVEKIAKDNPSKLNADEKGQAKAEKQANGRHTSDKIKKEKSNKATDKRKKKSEKLKKAEEKRKAIREKREKKAALKNKKKEEKLFAKAEREKAKAQKKIELARIKAHKKAEKEKAQAAAIREKNRRKEERIKRKQEIKAEKERRRDLIKHETKKQRQKRIAQEKAQRAEQKRIRVEEKAELKKQKFLAKKARKEQLAKDRQKNRERNRGFGGWLAAVISLGVATVVLASVLTYVFFMPNVADDMLEASYQRSFYDTVMKVDNMDLNLSKALATKDEGAMQKYLVELAINSELAESDIQQLPLQDENKFYTTKLINQIGDYAKYLNKKLIDGEGISAEEYAALERLYGYNLTLKNSLQNMLESVDGSFNFTSLSDGDRDNSVLSNFNELENLSVEYPELIYDGPFSDGKEDRIPKGLNGEKISDKLAVQKFNAIFAEYSLTDVKGVGSAEGSIKCYNVQGEKDGNILYAQISETGGKLIMFAYAGSCNGVNYQKDAAIATAEKFLAKTGIEDMKAVWVNLANNVYTINFAGINDGVIIYSDLVKVRVCAETGMVIGMEAVSYYSNHTDRVIKEAKISKEEAKAKVSENIDIDGVRLVIAPIGENSEKLCYEITGEYDGATYYVYIDAICGRQVQMFKVVKSTEGELLM